MYILRDYSNCGAGLFHSIEHGDAPGIVHATLSHPKRFGIIVFSGPDNWGSAFNLFTLLKGLDFGEITKGPSAYNPSHHPDKTYKICHFCWAPDYEKMLAFAEKHTEMKGNYKIPVVPGENNHRFDHYKPDTFHKTCIKWDVVKKYILNLTKPKD